MNRAAGMLGLCARAGRLITGEKAVVQAVRSKGAYLIVLDAEAAPNAVKAVTSACRTHGVPLCRMPGVGEVIGKPGRMAAAVTDEGMAKRVAQLMMGSQ